MFSNKKVLFLFLILLLGLGACSGPKKRYEPGSYSSEGDGYGQSKGPIHLTVKIGEDSKIEDIDVSAEYESESIGGEAIKKLKEEAIKKNSAEIDDVSGATMTSRGFKSALKDALDQAEMD